MTPHPAANRYPHRLPCASRMKPTTDAPAATPTPIPLDSQAIASVRRSGVACASSRLNPVISVGAMVIPHR
jgi:hypothetical protein